MKKIKNEAIPLITFVVCLLIAGFCICQLEMEKFQVERERINYITGYQVSKLQYVLNSIFLKTQTMEMLVIEGDGKVKNFDGVCEKLLDDESIRSLQLAPDGVVTFVYPLKGNEQAFGSLFDDPDRKTEAEYARDSGNMTLAGPYELSQGGLGAVARRPIYLKDANGKSIFWGFSIVVLNIPDAFHPAEFDKFTREGFEYKLHRINPNTKEVQIIDESSKTSLEYPIDVSFEVPNGTWTFSVAPKNGWVSRTSLFIEISIALAICILISLLTLAAVRLEEQRKKMENLSLIDGLTGIKNQRSLIKHLNISMEEHTPLSLFYLDFDGFKGINDVYGHICGDLFLIESAKRLSDAFGDYGNVFRIGGDEFAVVVDKVLPEDFYEQILEKFAEIFSKEYNIDNQSITGSASVGYSRYPNDAQDIDGLIMVADQSMYRMKNNRKSVVKAV